MLVTVMKTSNMVRITGCHDVAVILFKQNLPIKIIQIIWIATEKVILLFIAQKLGTN